MHILGTALPYEKSRTLNRTLIPGKNNNKYDILLSIQAIFNNIQKIKYKINQIEITVKRKLYIYTHG